MFKRAVIAAVLVLGTGCAPTQVADAGPTPGERQACKAADGFIAAWHTAEGIKDVRYESARELVLTSATGFADQASRSGNSTIVDNGSHLASDIRSGAWQDRFSEVIDECSGLGLPLTENYDDIPGI